MTWRAGSECDYPSYQDFKKALSEASFCFAGPIEEMGCGKKALSKAVDIAIENGYRYWAMQRMFKEGEFLVSFDHFMGVYVATCVAKINSQGL